MYLSTLRSHIEAMGDEREVVAHFPDGSVKISNFSGGRRLRKVDALPIEF
ncbi:MAG: hypothetical protein KGZ83_20400 [Sulfuricella sp.]|nr:hypothetical protein [Sulfuricella sp.]